MEMLRKGVFQRCFGGFIQLLKEAVNQFSYEELCIMAFSVESLLNKFDALQETQDSIVSTSQWVLFYYRHADKIVEEWVTYVSKCPERKKLALLYLCNDVVQQARAKKRLEFVDAFNKVLPSTLKIVHDNVSDPIKQKIVKIVKIWKERKIFSNPVEIEGVDIGSVSVSSSSSYSRSSSTLKKTETPEDKLKALAATPQKFNTFWHELLLAAHGDFKENHLDKLGKLTSIIEDTLLQLTDLKDNITNEVENLQQKSKSIEQKKQEIEQRQRKAEEEKRAREQKIIDHIKTQAELNMLPTYENDDSDSDSEDMDEDSEKEDAEKDDEEEQQEERPKKRLHFADDE